jgi:hypothetical protein
LPSEEGVAVSPEPFLPSTPGHLVTVCPIGAGAGAAPRAVWTRAWPTGAGGVVLLAPLPFGAGGELAVEPQEPDAPVPPLVRVASARPLRPGAWLVQCEAAAHEPSRPAA